jgi:hypothetical protein
VQRSKLDYLVLIVVFNNFTEVFPPVIIQDALEKSLIVAQHVEVIALVLL